MSPTAAGLIRLGIERYFELADAEKVAPLRALMADGFLYGEADPPTRPVVHRKKRLVPAPVIPQSEPGANRARLRARDAEFDAALEEGNRHFEATRGERSYRPSGGGVHAG